jgi:hypothetical protein
MKDSGYLMSWKDREFLSWLHTRLTVIHGEDPNYDYMHKLRAIISATPEDKDTPYLFCEEFKESEEPANQVDRDIKAILMHVEAIRNNTSEIIMRQVASSNMTSELLREKNIWMEGDNE